MNDFELDHEDLIDLDSDFDSSRAEPDFDVERAFQDAVAEALGE